MSCQLSAIADNAKFITEVVPIAETEVLEALKSSLSHKPTGESSFPHHVLQNC